jgi:hypothetical protein
MRPSNRSRPFVRRMALCLTLLAGVVPAATQAAEPGAAQLADMPLDDLLNLPAHRVPRSAAAPRPLP